MVRRTVLAATALLAGCPAAAAQTPPPRAIVTAVRTATPPAIDGRLIDECWAQAPPASEFLQRDPDEGRPATERTEIRFVYDDEALYIAARMFDSEPHLIARRLMNRDGDRDADRITIYLDSMHDRLTGALFGVSASNVQEDSIISNDTFQDSSWDAVWQSSVSIDDEGWSAEMRIPLSQLRFTAAEEQTWGVNVDRFIRRKNETVWLALVRKDESGLASRMAELTGFDTLRPRRHLELLPYAAARGEFIAPGENGDAFNDGARAFAAAGLDAKWGMTSNLMVNASVNPDFGQVEVDPAVVNLTAFETFFPEKRAFFLEGAQVFNNFGQGGSNSFWGFNTSDPSIFYSRRIGRAPQIEADGDDIDSPAATTILGAIKLTGKTSNGWSVGFLEAVTDRETARTRSGEIVGRTEVEPLTNYAVARAQRELGPRGAAGFMATSVIRKLDTPLFRSDLVDQAHVFGTDAYVFLDGHREWVVTGKISGSRVNGGSEAIEELQRAAQRYFQRPDVPHLSVDPTRTSLSGWAGRVNLNRNSGLVLVNAALWGVSPGFESNDLGFHETGDRAGGHVVIMWRGVTPNRFSRERNIWAAKAWTWNFNRDLQHDGYHARAGTTFLNYWYVNGGGLVWRRTQDDRLTRGGPSADAPQGRWWNVNVGSDSRKILSVRMNYNDGSNDQGHSNSRNHDAGIALSFRPSSMLTFSTGPEWSRSRTFAQYVTSVDDETAPATYGGRYVFGTIERRQLSMTTRASVILAPSVSIQLFMQPLISVGDYSDFKELARPRSFDFVSYGTGGRSLTLDTDSNEYTVDPDGALGAAPTFTFDNPDFNLKSLRLNTVFRWEMKPGSTFYAVWTRQQEDDNRAGQFALGRDARGVFSAPGDDVFLVKIAYWLGR
jgi:hypothetical protein